MMGDVTPEERASTPLLGRQAELAELAGRAGFGSDPRPAPVVLGGDAGMGKTRLLTEHADRAQAAGYQVLVGHCLDFGDSALPLLPFTEVFGRLDDAARERLAPVARSYPPLARLLPSPPGPLGPPQEDEGAVRGALFEGIHLALETLAASSPVLLVVEDAHWADRSTRDLLTFFFTRGFTGSVSVVVSYRADDLHRRHPLRPTLAEWGRLPDVVRMHLAPLADTHVRALVRASRPELAGRREVEEIVRRAEGNAFFAEELLVVQGLGGDAGATSSELPTELADLLLLRLDRLPDDTRAVVRAAACVGRRVPHLMLAEVVDLPGGTLDEALRTAVETNVLVAQTDGTYIFRHALLGEAVYADLLPGERTRLHAACSRALAEGRVPGAAAELARHARAGHDLVTAVRASVEAGEDAMRLGGPEEAAAHFLTALDLLSAPGVADGADLDRVGLVLQAADALVTAGRPPKALTLLHAEVGEVGASLDGPAGLAPEQRAELLVALSSVGLLVDTHRVSALAASAEALDLLRDQRTPLRVRALTEHARSNADRGRFEEATRLAQQAHELADQLGTTRLRTSAATLLGRLKSFSGDHDAALDAMTEVVQRLRREGDPAGLVRALHQQGGILFDRGRLEEARVAFRESWVLAQEHDRPWAPYGFDARVLSALVAYMVGDWDAVGPIVDTSDEQPPPQPAMLLTAVGLQVLAGRGDPAAARTLPSADRPSRPDAWQVILTTGAAIDIHGSAGDVDAAVEAYERGTARVRDLWQVPAFGAEVRLTTLLLAHLAVAATGAPGPERARLAALAEAPVAAAQAQVGDAGTRGRRPGPEGVAWATRLQAEQLRLRHAVGVDPPSAAELVTAWEEAVEAFHRLGHRFERARSAVRLATVLASTGPAGSARARELLDDARTFAEGVGARPLLAEITAAGGRGPTAPARAGAGHVAPLTPREREVLELVATGRSNGEIGKVLFITTKTVSVHVSNILAKLGVASRTEAAAVARDRGLVH